MSDKDKKIAAHGMTRGQHKELARQQSSGEPVKMIKANGKDAPEGFKIPAAEAGFVHFELEDRLFNQSTGDKLSTPYVQKMGVKEYVEAEKNKAFIGKAVAIFHYPKEAAEELGSATEGTRNVDSDFAAQQLKYEALTKSLPSPDWTPAQLDAAIKFAEHFPGATQPLTPVDMALNKTNVPPVILGTPAGNATAAENANISGPGALAALAADAARNTPSTQDDATSVGQETKPVENSTGNNPGGTSNAENNGNTEAEKAKEDADKAKADADAAKAKEDAEKAKADADKEKIPAGAGKRPSTLPGASANATKG